MADPQLKFDDEQAPSPQARSGGDSRFLFDDEKVTTQARPSLEPPKVQPPAYQRVLAGTYQSPAQAGVAERNTPVTAKETLRPIGMAAATALPIVTGGMSLPAQMAAGGIGGAANTAFGGGSAKESLVGGLIGAAIPPFLKGVGAAWKPISEAIWPPASPTPVGEVLPPDVYTPGYRQPTAHYAGPAPTPVPPRQGLMLGGQVSPAPELATAPTPRATPARFSGEALQGVPVRTPSEAPALAGVESPPQPPRGLEQAKSLSTIRPKTAAPRAIPGVDVPPSVGRLSESTDALARASEPPATAKPSAQLPIPGTNARPSVERVAEPPIPGVDTRPSIERLDKLAPAKPSAPSAKPVEPKPVTPTERASEVKAPTGVKPVVPSDEAVARMDRARTYRLGSHAGNPEADAYLTKTNQELVDEANARKIDGRDDWKVSDLKRTSSVHGKFLAPAKEDLIGKLLKPEGSGLPPKMANADVGRQVPNVQVRLGAKGEDLSDIISHEANMRQRAAEAQAAREKLGPLGLRSQEPTQTPPPPKGMKAGRYYDKYGNR